MRHALGWIAIGLALAAGCNAEGQRQEGTCTLADCSDGIWLTLVRPTSQATLPLPDGRYELELGYDDVNDVCTGLPSQVDPALACGDGAAHRVSFSTGSEGPVGVLVTIERHTPATLSVVLRRDGITLTSEVFELTYSELAPNGIECGPICQRATIEATLPREE